MVQNPQIKAEQTDDGADQPLSRGSGSSGTKSAFQQDTQAQLIDIMRLMQKIYV
jgi:hypothetical protein